MDTRKRLSYLDSTKDLLIIIVFHIQNLRRKNFLEGGIFWQGIKKMMIPYYVYGALLMFTRWMTSGFDLYKLKWQIVDLCSLRGIGAIWFLPCLFFAQLIYWGNKEKCFHT